MTEPDQEWTSDQELDRLAPLATSLHHWSPVYERWRGHESATARPQQPRFDRADLSAIDELRGVHFGRSGAASRRLRIAGEALTRIAESTTAVGSALAEGWRDDGSQRAGQRIDEIERGAQDCAALCARLGLHLQSALVDTVAPVISSAVAQILARSRRWEQTAARTSREVWEQRIAELDAAGPGSAGPAAADPSAQWQAELDALVVDYDAVIGLYRATLTAAADTVARVYQALHREIGPGELTPSGSAPVEVAAPVAGAGRSTAAAAVGGIGQEGESAPASTALASAGSGGAESPVAASSSAGGGGGSGGSGGAPDAGLGGPGGADGSALLGHLSDPPAGSSGGATLASASGDDPGYGAGAATAGAGGAALAPMAGALSSGAADDQQRTGRPWVVPAGEDCTREASWARLRALLGEDAGERPEPGRAGR